MSDCLASNRQVFGRLVWKELRQVQAYGFLIGLFAIGIQALTIWACLAQPSVRIDIETMELLATLMPVLMAMGCGGMIFSKEHEDGTFQFQRVLPASCRQVLGAKIGLVAAITGLLFVFCWGGVTLCQIAALRVGGNRVSVGVVPDLFGMAWSGLVVAEMLAWSLLFSASRRSGLLSISFAVIAGAGVFAIIEWLSCIAARPIQAGLLMHAATVLVLTILTTLKAKRWYASSGDLAVGTRWIAAPLKWIEFKNLQQGPFRSLVWLQVRSCFVALVAISLGVVFCSRFLFEPPGQLLWCTLVGAICLRGVAIRRSQLVAMGVSPKMVWWSQLLVPGFMIVSIAFLYSTGPSGLFWNTYGPVPGKPTAVYTCALTILGCCAAFLIGGYCALASRSSLINMLVAVPVATCVLVATFVTTHMVLSYGKPLHSLLVLVAVIGVTLLGTSVFFASWLKADCFGRLGWANAVGSKRWLRAYPASLVLSCVASVVVAAAAPIYLIPYVSDEKVRQVSPVPYDFDSATRDQLKSLVGSLRKVDPAANLRSVPTGDWKENVVAIAKDKMDLLLETPVLQLKEVDIFSRRKGPVAWYGENHSTVIEKCIECLLCDAINREDSQAGAALLEKLCQYSGQNLDPENYLIQWASLKGTEQTRIQAMITFLEQMDPVQGPLMTHVAAYHRESQRQAKHKPDTRVSWLESWEDLASARQANYLEANKWKLADVVRQAIHDGLSWFQFSEKVLSLSGAFERQLHHYWTPAFRHERKRRVMQLQLAIAGWRKEHQGKLPSSLGALVGVYFEQVPVDPMTGESFQYFPQGYDLGLQKYSQRLQSEFVFCRTRIQLEARRSSPCLLSPALARDSVLERVNKLYRFEQRQVFLYELEQEHFYELTAGERKKPTAEPAKHPNSQFQWVSPMQASRKNRAPSPFQSRRSRQGLPPLNQSNR